MWKKTIALVDMNAFFASIEQLDFPELRGQPIVVTNGVQGTCIITSSYEARKFGIKTGMRLREAKKYCPSLKVCASRPIRYAAVSSAIMASLKTVTPDIEVFSVDEAFLDLTRCKMIYGTSPKNIGELIKKTVFDASGLHCSIGISGDKTTAKYAAKCKKPNGLTIIHPEQAQEQLANVPVTALCGIGDGVGKFLATYGVHYCGDIKKLPISVLARRFGNIGRRIWYMCQGADPDPVRTGQRAIKSLGHGKVMPPNTHDVSVIKTYLKHMSEKVAGRLRKNQLEAQHFYIGFKEQASLQWFGQKQRLTFPTQHGDSIYQVGLQLLSCLWHGQDVCQIQVTALDPQPNGIQPDLFQTAQTEDEETNNQFKPKNIDSVLDSVNERFGANTLMAASLLNRSTMNDVISPSWRPEGHRKSI